MLQIYYDDDQRPSVRVPYYDQRSSQGVGRLEYDESDGCFFREGNNRVCLVAERIKEIPLPPLEKLQLFLDRFINKAKNQDSLLCWISQYVCDLPDSKKYSWKNEVLLTRISTLFIVGLHWRQRNRDSYTPS